MANITVYVPDKIAEAIKKHPHLNKSKIFSEAMQHAMAMDDVKFVNEEAEKATIGTRTLKQEVEQ